MAKDKIVHTVHMPDDPKPCPRCGGTNFSIRILAHRVKCRICKGDDGQPLDITDEVSTWRKKN